MSNLSVFHFESSEVRFVNGKPVANDVAKILGYSNPSDTIRNKVNDDYKENETIFSTTSLDSQVIVLKEAGIYQLIFSSKLDSAKRFQKWVFEEVLPQIRKTGLFNSCPFKLSDESSLVRFEQDDYWTTSTTIAEIFGKEHYNVLRDLEQAQKDALKFEGMSKNLPTFKLVESTYLDKYGRATKCYRINRSLFNYVVLAYQGDNAKLYRMMFIKAFEDLELKVKVFLTQQMLYSNPKRQQVYILKNTMSGMIKVGITNDISRRVAEIQNASGCEISVEYLAPKADNAKEIESKIHKYFGEQRGIGEWFNVNTKDVIEILEKESLVINATPFLV